MTPTTQRHIPLTTLGIGRTARVAELGLLPQDAAYLRALGLRPNASVRLCRVGEPCILEILAVQPGSGPCGCDCACRIGLASELAQKVLVVAVDEGRNAS